MCSIMTVDLILFISLISHCRKAQRAARKIIYQNIITTICWVPAEAYTLVNRSHFYLICALCHISFLYCGRQCLVCYVFLCIFFCVHWHALDCSASSEEMFSHSRSRNCYTSHPSGKTRCRVYYNTLSAGQEWTRTHTEYSRWHWKPPLSSLPLWSTHAGLDRIHLHCSFEQFQCGTRLICINHYLSRGFRFCIIAKRGGLLFSCPITSTLLLGLFLWTCHLGLFA